MLVNGPFIIIYDKSLQLLKTVFCISVTLGGKIQLFKLLQFANVSCCKTVICVLYKLTFCKLLHPLKHIDSIVVKLLSKLILFKF